MIEPLERIVQDDISRHAQYDYKSGVLFEDQ